jgi:hypothetical protein
MFGNQFCDELSGTRPRASWLDCAGSQPRLASVSIERRVFDVAGPAAVAAGIAVIGIKHHLFAADIRNRCN